MKKKRKPSFRYRRFWTISLLIVMAVLTAAVIRDWRGKRTGDVLHQDGKTAKSREIRGAEEKRGPGKGNRRIAIIVDDIGYDLSKVDELIRIQAPLTFAILPYCTYSLEAAERLHRAGKEILLHLPMEPKGREKNPGRGVLLSGMDEEEIRKVLEEDLHTVPHAVGVNNHMGSKFMEDGKKLNALFRALEEKGLFFVDSRTTGYSQGRTAAEETGIPFAARDIFIDSKGDPGNGKEDLAQLVKMHRHRSRLVIIGHPYPGTIAAVRKSVESLMSAGIEIVPVSKLVKR